MQGGGVLSPSREMPGPDPGWLYKVQGAFLFAWGAGGDFSLRTLRITDWWGAGTHYKGM